MLSSVEAAFLASYIIAIQQGCTCNNNAIDFQASVLISQQVSPDSFLILWMRSWWSLAEKEPGCMIIGKNLRQSKISHFALAVYKCAAGYAEKAQGPL